jgi:serine protease SohB
MHSADLINYFFFLLRSLTIVISILIVIGVSLALTMRNKMQQKHRLVIKNLSKKYVKYKKMLHAECFNKAERKAFTRTQKLEQKRKKESNDKKRLFILEFKGDIQASTVTSLSEAINALLLVADPQKDQVLLKLENQGGTIHGHGLAAAQLQRLREANIHLTVSVDKVAASGGYMMASVANRIIAAPFSIIGSIGVIVQLPNFHHLLKKKDVDFEQITAGDYKRTLSIFGENTKDGRKKMQEEVDIIHELFKQFVKTHRPNVDLSKVATGEYWLGQKALTLQLVDELNLSDQFILNLSHSHDIYEISYLTKKSWLARLHQRAESAVELIFQKASRRTTYL